MSTNAKSDARFLNTAEQEMVNETRSPAIEAMTAKELTSVARRLKQALSRAKDVGAQQQREMRGKAAPRGAKPAKDNEGTLEKARVLNEAIQRVDAELSRREQVITEKPSQAALARHALEMKMTSKGEQHLDPGRSASPGMQPKQREKPPKIGTTRKEVGRVSQAGKVAQARKDGGK